MRITRVDFERALNAALLESKYVFLYDERKSSTTTIHPYNTTQHMLSIIPTITTTIKSNNVVFAYIIHKIEIYPRYNYPTVQNNNNYDNNNNDIMDATTTRTTTTTAAGMVVRENDNYVLDTSSSSSAASSPPPPYRTVSHYGFNYPLTYLPTISLYPQNLLAFTDDITAVQLQRHLVIEFIKSTALSLKNVVVAKDAAFISSKEIHMASVSSCHETTDETTEEEHINYTTVKRLELMRPSAGRRKRWPRTISSSSSTAHSMAMTASTAPTTTTTSTYPEHEEDDSLSTNFSHCSITSPIAPPPPPPPPPAPPLPEYRATNTEHSNNNSNNKNINNNIDHKNTLRTYIFRKSQKDDFSGGGGVAEVEYIQRHKTETEHQDINSNDENNSNDDVNNKSVLLERRDSSTSSVSTTPIVRARSQQSISGQQKEDKNEKNSNYTIINKSFLVF